jgi:hypothetical protein
VVCEEVGECKECVTGNCVWCILPSAVDDVFNTASGVCASYDAQAAGNDDAPALCAIGLPVVPGDVAMCPGERVLLTEPPTLGTAPTTTRTSLSPSPDTIAPADTLVHHISAASLAPTICLPLLVPLATLANL